MSSALSDFVTTYLKLIHFCHDLLSRLLIASEPTCIASTNSSSLPASLPWGLQTVLSITSLQNYLCTLSFPKPFLQPWLWFVLRCSVNSRAIKLSTFFLFAEIFLIRLFANVPMSSRFAWPDSFTRRCLGFLFLDTNLSFFFCFRCCVFLPVFLGTLDFRPLYSGDRRPTGIWIWQFQNGLNRIALRFLEVSQS